MVLKDSNAFIQTLLHVYPGTCSSCTWPIFFSFSPFFPHCVASSQREGRRGGLRPLPVGKALMFSSVMTGGRRHVKSEREAPAQSHFRLHLPRVSFTPHKPPTKSPSPSRRFVFLCACLWFSPVGVFKDISGVYGKQERCHAGGAEGRGGEGGRGRCLRCLNARTQRVCLRV